MAGDELRDSEGKRDLDRDEEREAHDDEHHGVPWHSFSRLALGGQPGLLGPLFGAVELAALPEGASLSFTRLQEMLELTPGNLITHLRKLEDAGYLESETSGNGRASRTAIALTDPGRAALDTYTTALRDLLGGL